MRGKRSKPRSRSRAVTRADIAEAGKATVLEDHEEFVEREEYRREHGREAYLKKYPFDVRLPRRAAAEAVATKIANRFGADPKRILEILYFPSDLTELFVQLNVEETFERAKRAAAVLRRVHRILETAGWPFDTFALPGGFYTPSPLGFLPNPLSKEVFARLLDRHDFEKATRQLRSTQENRRKLGINKGPRARSFERLKVIRVKGRDLWTYLARCVAVGKIQNPEIRKRIMQLDFLGLRDELSRTEKAALTRATVDLVNQTFPNVARLTPAQLGGSIPAAQRRRSRESRS